jgi:hypothetical protein
MRWQNSWYQSKSWQRPILSKHTAPFSTNMTPIPRSPIPTPMFGLDIDSAPTIQKRHDRMIKYQWPAFQIRYCVGNSLYNRVSKNGAGHDTDTTIFRNSALVLILAPIFFILGIMLSQVGIPDNSAFVSRGVTSGMAE